MIHFDLSRKTYALVTSTTYGTWLPGDARSYVSKNNIPGTPFDTPQPLLEHHIKKNLKKPICYLNSEHAQTLWEQWQSIVSEIQGRFLAVAIMPNHFHFVIAVAGSTTKEKLLYFFKSKGSRALNKQFGKQTWWTESGSVRFCNDEAALLARIEYVKNQQNALLVWSKENNDPVV